ncbi:hypothetical protein DRO61_11530 [Candidatus Bathyarchaeota archaeon]|nr:MAG: hypothetical protein DRO61_11530 [Candidatus Bathyarchaeota archaeon]
MDKSFIEKDDLQLRPWPPQQLAHVNPTDNYFEGSRFVQELSPKDFDPVSLWKLKDSKCGIILFYKPGCKYCMEVKPQWEHLGETAAFFNVYAFNSEKYHSHIRSIGEQLPSLITSYPTIIIYENGVPKEHYQGVRDWNHLTLECARVCSGDHDKVRDIELLTFLGNN